MAKIRLDIETRAHLEGLERTHQQLASLESAGKTVTQTFRQTTDFRAYSAAIQKSFHEAGLSGKNLTQSITASEGTFRTAVREIQRHLAEGRAISFYSKDGVKRDSTNIQEIVRRLRNAADEMQAEYKQMAMPSTPKARAYSFKTFDSEVRESTEGLLLFGTELEHINAQIALVKQQGLKLIDAGASVEEVEKLRKKFEELSDEQVRLQKEADGTGGRIKKLIWNFVSAQAIVYVLRRAFSALVQGVKEASVAAAEAEQVYEKFFSVFDGMKGAADSVQELVMQFGLAKTSAMEIMATIGDMAVGMGATDYEAAAFAAETSMFIQDLIAFKDLTGDVVEISQAFMSGVAGNTRNFRQWGSVVKESTVLASLHAKGLANLTGQELEWAKAQERANIVMEQQRNAIGATEREWHMLINVGNRYNQQTKQLKENVGEIVNVVLLPLKTALLDHVEAWNDAYEARKRYLDEDYDPISDEDLAGSVREETARREARNFFAQQMSLYSSGTGSIRDLLSELTGGWIPKKKGFLSEEELFGIGADQLVQFAKGWNISLAATADILEEAGFTINDWAQGFIKHFDIETQIGQAKNEANDAINAYAQQMVKSIESLAELTGIAPDVEQVFRSLLSGKIETDGRDEQYISRMSEDIAKEGAAQMASIIEKLTGADATVFMSAFDVAIGADAELGLSEKQAQLRTAYESLNNTMLRAISEDDDVLKNAIEPILQAIVDEYLEIQDLLDTDKGFLGFEKQSDALREQLALQEKRGELLAQYGSGNEEIVNILLQQEQALLGLDKIKQEAIEAGWDELEAEKERLAVQEQILELYKLQRREKEQSKREEALDFARGAMADVQKARSLVGASASAVRMAEIDEQVWALSEVLTQGGLTLGETLEKTSAYREELEMLAAEEMHQAVIDSLLALTDYDMVSGIVDLFAEGDVWGGLGAIAAELLQYMDVAQQLMTLVSELFEVLGPFIDQILEPLLPVVEMIFDIIGDIVYPVLVAIYPVLQIIATVLIYFMAVIKTVTNTLSWMGHSIETFVWNLFHPFRKREYRNLAEETVEIWDDANAKVKDIWDKELDHRMDFVNDLTDVQKAEIKAYEEMYKKGLVSLTEKEAMIGKKVFGRTWDLVDIESFGTGGDFITNGEQLIRVGELGRERVTITPVDSPMYRERYGGEGGGTANYTVVVNGATADPEAIAMAVRREFRLMERRGTRYA